MHISLGKYADLPAVAAETAELKAMLILDALLTLYDGSMFVYMGYN